jgi:hypothetical protein
MVHRPSEAVQQMVPQRSWSIAYFLGCSLPDSSSSSTSTAAAWSINLDRARFDREGCSSRDSSSSKSSRSAGQPLMIHSCRVATRVLAAMQCLLHLSTASYSHRNHSSERMSCSTGTINAASPAPTKAFVGISSSPGPIKEHFKYGRT